MRFLNDLIKSLHFVLGITAPSPEQERTVALIWLGSVVFFVGGLWLLFRLAF